MITKPLCLIFYVCIFAISPLLIPIVIYQLLLDKRIIHNRKLYSENKLNNRIYARKCETRIITDKKIVKRFLRQNHMFGAFIIMFYLTNFKKHKIVGLYYEDKLVFITCFKYLKNKKGIYNYATCSLTNTSVTGGASKCIKHIDETISTISFRKSKLYNTLGFKEDGYCNLLEMMLGVHSKSGMFKYWIKEKE